MKAIFKGKILDYEINNYSVSGGGDVLLSGRKFKDPIMYWGNFHERDLNELKIQLYINDIIELDSNTKFKIEEIIKDLDGNRYYYTNYIIENRRLKQ